MDGRETCALEDDLAVALAGRDGARWVSVFLAQCAAGIRPDAQSTAQAQRDWARAQRAIDVALVRWQAQRGQMPRGREYAGKAKT